MRDLKRVFTHLHDLPRAERLATARGLPAHLADGVALLATRFVPPDWYLGRGGDRRVLVIHGYAGHPRSHGLLRRHLRRRGFQTLAIDLSDHERIEEAAEALTEFLLREVSEDAPIQVVAHSLGGITCRRALQDPDVRARVSRLITLGTPHHGTQTAELINARMVNGLEPDSDLLAQLDEQIPWDDEYPSLIALWSPTDLLMVPPEAASADGARNLEVQASHYGYMVRPSIWQTVGDLLESGLD